MSTFNLQTAREENKDNSTRPERCTYRNCRHTQDQHGRSFKINGKTFQCKCKHFTSKSAKGKSSKGQIIDPNLEEFKALCAILDAVETYCDCGSPRSSFDVMQEWITDVNGKKDILTFHDCPKCHYGLQPWKIGRRITRDQVAEVRAKGVKIPDGWVIE